MKLPAVLNELRLAQQHLAIVTDEYGGTLGVVSMEDVLEQIVGEIWDETDIVEPNYTIQPNGSYEIDGDMAISEFLELMEIPEDEFDFDSDTVGGWAIELNNGFPEPEDQITYENLVLTILKTEERRVEKLLIRRENPEPEE
jgi:CBS domain containing-hemolysin-like protein